MYQDREWRKEPVPELNTDHEDADTKIAYLLQHA